MKQIIALISLTLLAISPLPSAPAPRQAQVTAGTNQGATEVRVALPEFQASSSDTNTLKLTALFNQVLHDDLDYSGNILLVNKSFYPLGTFQTPADIKISDWTKADVNAQYLAFGNVTIRGGQQFYVQARLWDLGVVQNPEVLAQGLGSDLTEDGVRLIAHKFSDMIVDSLFGGKFGIASTKIAYVKTTSSANKDSTKEVYVMDYDGANAFPLTTYRSISITPSWAPDGEKVAFTTYRTRVPNIEIMSRIDRRLFPFPAVGGTTTTPAWSPDGSQIAFASSKDGADVEIYVADWNGRNMRRLTISKGVDISPAWSPTGRQIVFVSERSGSQQLYTMDVEGTNVQRIISEGGDAENPTWSADGRSIAFAWKRPGVGHYDIYIHDLASGKNGQLTQDSGDNERPSWAPDGRHLVFASTRSGTSQIYSMLANGRKLRQLTRNGKNEGPAWSGFIGK